MNIEPKEVEEVKRQVQEFIISPEVGHIIIIIIIIIIYNNFHRNSWQFDLRRNVLITKHF